MAYQTGVPASTKDLIDTFIAFAVANSGFTLGNEWTYTADASWNPASGSGAFFKARALAHGGEYVYLAWPTDSGFNPSGTLTNRVVLNTGTNNPTTGRTDAQTDGTSNTVIQLGTAPLRYWMFGDSSGAHCVTEWVGGAYQHISIGQMQKYGAFTGGLYVTGSTNNTQQSTGSSPNTYWSWTSANHGRPFDAWGATGMSSSRAAGHLRCTYGGNTKHVFGQETGSAGGVASNLHMLGQRLWPRGPNIYNGRAPLIPVELIVASSDSASPTQWAPVGRVNNAAFINIANIVPADTILTDWMVFPVSSKNSSNLVSSGVVNSDNYGMAYKK